MARKRKLNAYRKLAKKVHGKTKGKREVKLTRRHFQLNISHWLQPKTRGGRKHKKAAAK